MYQVDMLMPDLSFVVPVYNERESISQLADEIATACANLSKRWELYFVDDGSTDRSAGAIEAVQKKYPQVGLLRMRRNFGKAAALSAGFAVSSGAIVFTLDGDLQDDPKEIPKFLAELDKGFDCVTGWKVARQDPVDKTLPSKVFNYIVRKMTGVYLRDINCGFKAYRREALEGLELIGEMHRFIPVLLHGKGFSIAEIPVDHRKRVFGKSKYGLTRMLKGILDLLTVIVTTQFRERPLHIFGSVGLLLVAVGVLTLCYLTGLWLVNEPIGNRPLLTLGVLLVLVGTNFIGTGLLAELIQRRDQSRPSVSIREIRKPASQEHLMKPAPPEHVMEGATLRSLHSKGSS
jgi:glycosyltransferase involved in cell wall biosynthesis